MMDNSLQLSIITSILFFVMKVVEQKYIQKLEKIEYKQIFRNSIVSGIATFVGNILVQQFMMLQSTTNTPTVFTGEPGF